MKRNIRIIPRLDIKGSNLVKGIHLEGLRVLGKPEQFARYYYETGADELVYMDVVASLYGRNSLHDVISSASFRIALWIGIWNGDRSFCTVLKGRSHKCGMYENCITLYITYSYILCDAFMFLCVQYN